MSPKQQIDDGRHSLVGGQKNYTTTEGKRGKKKKSRSNRRSSIKVLLLGDAGVGKSSVISTFVSRHFSSVVPGILTRVKLPSDPIITGSIITTIMDSQAGDVALLSVVGAVDQGIKVNAVAEMEYISDSLRSFGVGIEATHNKDVAIIDKVERSVNFGGGIDHVDSIILVYDLGRMETFHRLENHWLPLIERCYRGKLPVIIAGNKLDLLYDSSDPELTQTQNRAHHRQVVALLQRFTFVRECIKCSAKKLINIDGVFLKARDAVLYPITPALYDLEKYCLADNCKRSIMRIFRMYDVDNDGLLSSIELNAFQQYAFTEHLREEDFKGWQKLIISQHDESPVENQILRDGKFTPYGFMCIFDIFICQNRLEVPWRILRLFGYDNDLNLHIPRSLLKSQMQFERNAESGIKVWGLSSSAKKFLTAIFHQFNSSGDGILSRDDILKIFWVIPGLPLPPWHSNRANDLFQDSISRLVHHNKNRTICDKSLLIESDILIDGVTICNNNSMPSVEEEITSNADDGIEPMSYRDWMGHWCMMSAVSPSLTRAELYRLGHIENPSVIGLYQNDYSSSLMQPNEHTCGMEVDSSETHLVVIGKRGCGKTTLINYLRSTNDNIQNEEDKLEEDSSSLPPFSNEPKTSFTWLHQASHRVQSNVVDVESKKKDHISYFIFTEIPGIDQDENNQRDHATLKLNNHILGKNGTNLSTCDLVLFVFDPSDIGSFNYVQEVENAVLSDDIPRVFIACANNEKLDTTFGNDIALEMSFHHCKKMNLEPPIIISSKDDNVWKRSSILQFFCCCNEKDSIKVIPRRKETQKRRVIKWLGGLLTASIVISIFFDRPKRTRKDTGTSWLKQFL